MTVSEQSDITMLGSFKRLGEGVCITAAIVPWYYTIIYLIFSREVSTQNVQEIFSSQYQIFSLNSQWVPLHRCFGASSLAEFQILSIKNGTHCPISAAID